MNKFHWLNSSLLLIKSLGVNARNIGCGVKNHTRYLFWQKVRYYGIEKNNCVTELMRLPVSASNSL